MHRRAVAACLGGTVRIAARQAGGFTTDARGYGPDRRGSAARPARSGGFGSERTCGTAAIRMHQRPCLPCRAPRAWPGARGSRWAGRRCTTPAEPPRSRDGETACPAAPIRPGGCTGRGWRQNPMHQNGAGPMGSRAAQRAHHRGECGSVQTGRVRQASRWNHRCTQIHTDGPESGMGVQRRTQPTVVSSAAAPVRGPSVCIGGSMFLLALARVASCPKGFLTALCGKDPMHLNRSRCAARAHAPTGRAVQQRPHAPEQSARCGKHPMHQNQPRYAAKTPCT